MITDLMPIYRWELGYVKVRNHILLWKIRKFGENLKYFFTIYKVWLSKQDIYIHNKVIGGFFS